MAFYYSSEINKRSVNEDSYCNMEIRMNHEATVSAMVVADGMGGLSAGKRYSEGAINLWYEELVKTVMGDGFRDGSLPQQIDALMDFSDRIFEKINRKLYQKGMDAGVKGGTTLSSAIHFWDTWIIANCGDSPIYLMKNGSLSLTSDIQNVASQLVKKGMTRTGSTLFYQNKNRLTEYLGKREEVNPYCIRLNDDQLDSLILGSDGAFGDLSLEQIEEILNQQKDPQEILKDLFEQARNGGEEDNQTAVLYVRDKKITEDTFHMNFYGDLKLEDTFQSSMIPFCSYTELEADKKNSRLKEKLMHRWMGGKEE